MSKQNSKKGGGGVKPTSDLIIGKFGKQYEQYRLDFDEEFKVSAEGLRIMGNIPHKLYSFPDLILHPFPLFFANKSETVRLSRKAYNADVTRKRLSKATKKDGTPYTDKEIEAEVAVHPKDMTKTFADGMWKVVASWEYGFPNELDAHVWGYIELKVSQIYKETGGFDSVYFFSIEEIKKHLVKKSVFSTLKGGRQNQLVMDAIYRIANTKYYHERGIKWRLEKGESRKGHKTQQHKSSFSLINEIFERGEVFPDGTHSHKIGIMISPIMIRSFRNDYFYITSNQTVDKICNAKGIRLYQTLCTYFSLAYNNNSGIVKGAYEFKGIPFAQYTYSTLCNITGVEPLKGRRKYKNAIAKQFKDVFGELLNLNILDFVHIHEYKKNREKEFMINLGVTVAEFEEIMSFRTKLNKIADSEDKVWSLEDEKYQSYMKEVMKRVPDHETRVRIMFPEMAKLSKSSDDAEICPPLIKEMEAKEEGDTQ